MTFSQAVRICFSKYFTFSGRASRPEYWWFALFVFAGSFVAGIFDGMIFGFSPVEVAPNEISYESDGPLAAIFSLVTLVPILSAGWRRMHDSGRSGLHLLYPLIVLIGITIFMGFVSGFDTMLAGDFAGIITSGSSILIGLAIVIFFLSPLLVLWWLTRPSDPTSNEYGPPPSHIASPSA
ncbi:DUF805 domain-containing protein [Maribius pontilimi]|uniref:DUF805 domain-containing protein n=1 Tax=Palleronia pontilimi TaxID=1964209 RepID=A0A934IID3_9RHOB|nr:DUF805 domain-containing protein [Palleronia pontilimi]MBJ3763915.1 DUF805 domain-containing protein [Palleronia pontilimi]